MHSFGLQASEVHAPCTCVWNRQVWGIYHPRLKMYIHWGTGIGSACTMHLCLKSPGMGNLSPTTKNVYSLGGWSQKNILGPFGRVCIPHPVSYILIFWGPPCMHTFTTFCMKWGGTYLYALCLVSPQGVPRKLLDKKIDKFQTESLSYILSCLVGCLGDWILSNIACFSWFYSTVSYTT